ncbi:MAG TPA: hypothetical protein VGB37_11440, partial [Candidatus Lokiarchaeia archaeon]
YGWLEGFATVFYFSLRTFIGLFPLALAKQTAETFIPKETEKIKSKTTIFIIMILIIIGVNIIIMILSFLRIHIFPVKNL